MAAISRIPRAVLTIPFFYIALLGQSGPSVTDATTFHVRGTIRSSFDSSPIAGAEVKFAAKKITKSVFSDSRGFYRAELPVGIYTMSASRGNGEKYRRPQFRVASSRIVIVDVTLYADAPDCDAVFPRIAYADGTPKSRAPTQDDYNDVCGGQDYVPIPSEHDLTLDLLVSYSTRRKSDSESTYNGSGPRSPVFAAYNLYTLTAAKVVYDATNRTIAASGNVIISDGSGKTQHAESMTLKIASLLTKKRTVDATRRLRSPRIGPTFGQGSKRVIEISQQL